jgi:hypothetical protein
MFQLSQRGGPEEFGVAMRLNGEYTALLERQEELEKLKPPAAEPWDNPVRR